MKKRAFEPTDKAWGGTRPGAGRPATGRKRASYYVTPDEDAEIKKLIEQMRNKPAE